MLVPASGPVRLRPLAPRAVGVGLGLAEQIVEPARLGARADPDGFPAGADVAGGQITEPVAVLALGLVHRALVGRDAAVVAVDEVVGAGHVVRVLPGGVP